MGQKVHPYGFRLGFNKTWRSRWYADREYAKLLHEDLALRDNLKARFQHAGVAKIEIERAANKLKISIFTSRPGIIIGRKGQEVDKLKQEIQKKTGKEVFYSPTEQGEAFVRQYREVREDCLVKSLDTELNADIGELARLLRTMSGMYDQAARAASSL